MHKNPRLINVGTYSYRMIENFINNKNYLEGLSLVLQLSTKGWKSGQYHNYLCLKGLGAKVMLEVGNTITYVGNILLIALQNYELHNGYLQTLTRIIQDRVSLE